MQGDPTPVRRFPRVPMERRVSAFLIDFGSVALFSAVGGPGLFVPLFLISWIGMRVILVSKNQGQSLGRWAMDIKVIHARYRGIPGLAELFKREALTGIGSLLVMIGLANLNPSTGWVLLTFIPLAIDCSFAFVDPDYQQAFHDRLARTAVSQTRRGYSLDIKVKKLFAQANRRMK